VQLLWNGDWLETPAYPAGPSTESILVAATVPLHVMGDRGGREYHDRWRKLRTFVVLEGPRSALQKALTKRRLARLSSDYRVVLISGHDEQGEPLIALALRSAPCAEQVVAHVDLIRRTESLVEGPRLEAIAAALDKQVGPRLASITQSYLHSGENPPEWLAGALGAVDLRRGSASGERSIRPPRTQRTATLSRRRATSSGRSCVTVLGAGDYAQTEILPAAAAADLEIALVVDREPQVASFTAERFDAAAVGTSAGEAIAAAPEGMVVIATAHDSHAVLAVQALEAGHHVLLEKPPVVTVDDLRILVSAIRRHPGRLMVGFNRRHHPLVRSAREFIRDEGGPVTFNARVKEVDVPPGHWYLWPNQGTRVTGNICHWLDLGVWFAGAWPSRVHVAVGGDPTPIGEPPEIVISSEFDDSSFMVVHATSRGDGIRGVQERIEARSSSRTVEVDDLRVLRTLCAGRSRRTRLRTRSRAHAAMYAQAFALFAGGEPFVVDERELIAAALLQIHASALVRAGGGVAEIPGMDEFHG
jgi:predicted dehydrogenase